MAETPRAELKPADAPQAVSPTCTGNVEFRPDGFFNLFNAWSTQHSLCA